MEGSPLSRSLAQQDSEGSLSFLSSLNPQQRLAAEHFVGPLLVIAGAGTGKTKTLAARVAALIQAGVSPQQILLLTFTRRAAREMIRRAGQVVGEAIASRVWGGTFHSVAHRLLRTYAQPLGLMDGFTVMDQGDAEDLLNLIRTELGLQRSKARFPQKHTLLAIYSRCVNASEPLDQVLSSRFPWCQEWQDQLKQMFQTYTQRKAERHLLDYDDLLLYWSHALEGGAGKDLAARFQHVLVDEYQDTNPLQAAILSKMWQRMTADSPGDKQSRSPANVSLMVVGDDAQSIYAFRGATVANILNFPKQFAGTTQVTLEQNYRSTQPILSSSNAIMEGANHRYAKNLWSERASEQKPLLVTCADEMMQAVFVAEQILQHREEGIPLIEQAVLFRASHNSDALEVELSRRNIPFVKWGGLRFLEAAHIKDLLAFLRILENPRDDLSWLRVLQLLDGVGPGRARQAFEHVRHADQVGQALGAWQAPAACRQQVQDLAELLQHIWSADPPLPLAIQIDRIRRFYVPMLERRYEQPEMRARDLDQLELLAAKAADRATFLADLTLDPPVSTGDFSREPFLDEEYVVLSTIHSAKGCEWDAVYVIHVADGVLPSDMVDSEEELDEERRLLYVAMTRARDWLYLTLPLRYYHRKHALGSAYSTAQVSRFLPPVLFPLFERKGFDAKAAPEEIMHSPTTDLAASVQARLRSLWG